VGRHDWGSEVVHAAVEWGPGAKFLMEGLGEGTQKLTTLFVKICYFEPVLRHINDCMNHFNIKSKKKSIWRGKVVSHATVLAHSAQKVHGRADCPPSPVGFTVNGSIFLLRRWLILHMLSPKSLLQGFII